jgi:hypothetical protein
VETEDTAGEIAPYWRRCAVWDTATTSQYQQTGRASRRDCYGHLLMCDFAHGRRDGSWLTFSSHGTHAVILLQGFQGKTQTAENDRVRSSMKYSLPIGSLPAWCLPTAGEPQSCTKAAMASIIPACGMTYSRWLVTLLHGRSSDLPRRA